jgi:hypothetical protein
LGEKLRETALRSFFLVQPYDPKKIAIVRRLIARTLAFSVVENIGPMIETVPLEQAADAYARIGESEATQHATKWMRRSEPSPNLTGEQNEYHS